MSGFTIESAMQPADPSRGRQNTATAAAGHGIFVPLEPSSTIRTQYQQRNALIQGIS
jgi:hypothetical protein